MKKGVDYIGITIVPITHDGNGKYLLGLRTDKCRDEHWRWDTVGAGGLEFGETIETALGREMGEEIFATPIKQEFLGTREVLREHEGKQTHWVTFDFRVLVDPEAVKNMEPEKCAELGWFALEDFPDPLHSQFPKFLEKYKDRL